MVSAYRVIAENIIKDLRLTTKRHEAIVERLEFELIEATARGRRMARLSMKSRRRRRRLAAT
jgi:hypothetical protein